MTSTDTIPWAHSTSTNCTFYHHHYYYLSSLLSFSLFFFRSIIPFFGPAKWNIYRLNERNCSYTWLNGRRASTSAPHVCAPVQKASVSGRASIFASMKQFRCGTFTIARTIYSTNNRMADVGHEPLILSCITVAVQQRHGHGHPQCILMHFHLTYNTECSIMCSKLLCRTIIE